jgi:hypothetical protein
MGDIPLGVWAYRWFNLLIERPKMARIENWYELKAAQTLQTHYDSGDRSRRS